MMIAYATSAESPPLLPLPKDRFVVRIVDSNEPSIRLFEKLGFAITKKIEVFEEVEMRMRIEVARRMRWNGGEVRKLVL